MISFTEFMPKYSCKILVKPVKSGRTLIVHRGSNWLYAEIIIWAHNVHLWSKSF